MNVVDLDAFRERRTVRRVAAVAVVATVIYGTLERAAEMWLTVERAIRWAARQLPDDQEDTVHADA